MIVNVVIHNTTFMVLMQIILKIKPTHTRLEAKTEIQTVSQKTHRTNKYVTNNRLNTIIDTHTNQLTSSPHLLAPGVSLFEVVT